VLTGILFKIASAFCFTVMAALIRNVGGDVPAGEVVFARSAFALVPILIWLIATGQLGAVRTARLGGHFLRSGVGVVSMFCMFSGLARLPLPDATMLNYASPLITVLLAGLILREPLRLPRMAAVTIGLAGVAIMLWPHLADGSLLRAFSGGGDARASQGALFALSGAFFSACAMIQIRRLVQSEATASIVFWFTILSSLFGLATLPLGSVWPDIAWVWPEDFWMATQLVAIGCAGGVGQILLTSGYRYAEASVIAPFEYTTLIWALSIGWFAFGDLPDWFALAGGLVVIASGIVVIQDERRRGIERNRALQAGQPPV
jgi:drug/metabolite transporter (DMT)-like permease